ncbi:effector-associated constant component EACC1 [Streptomyces gardneri]|uniref:effector-associated constant component EACC1 n=1 Tax=Streptomyces gardneri TaxID=66892 RepID=UPI0035E06A39
MDETIEIRHTDGVRHLEDLKRFLVRDPSTRTIGRYQLRSTEPAAGTLGDGLDVLTLVVSGTLALPAFIQVVSNWFKSRGEAPEAVEIRLGSARIAVSGTEDPAEIRRLADILQAAYPENTASAGDAS